MGLINFETPSIPKQNMDEFLWVASGVNKIGKTTLASQFPAPYFFLFEPGSSGLLTYETDILTEANRLNKHPWKLFKEAVDEFVKNDGYQFKTAVVDPVSTAYDYCENWVCQKLGIDHVSDLPFGKGYAEVRDEYSDVLKKLHAGNFTSLLISHTKDVQKSDGLGNEVSVVDLDITGKSGKFLKNYTDIFLLLDFNKEGERKIFVRPSTNQEAGSRLVFENNEIDLNFESLKEEFDKAITNNNKKSGISQDMIDQFYNKQKEKVGEYNRLQKAKNKIKSLVNDLGWNGKQASAYMKKEIGCIHPDEITDISQAEKFIEFLEKQKG